MTRLLSSTLWGLEELYLKFPMEMVSTESRGELQSLGQLSCKIWNNHKVLPSHCQASFISRRELPFPFYSVFSCRESCESNRILLLSEGMFPLGRRCPVPCHQIACRFSFQSNIRWFLRPRRKVFCLEWIKISTSSDARELWTQVVWGEYWEYVLL